MTTFLFLYFVFTEFSITSGCIKKHSLFFKKEKTSVEFIVNQKLGCLGS